MSIDYFDIAKSFRCAIEKALSLNYLVGNMRFFPNGCCDYSSEFLQKYMFEEYGTDTALVSGTYGDDSHSWLETDEGIIIDITGDQYKRRRGKMYYNCPVYVGPMDAFHRIFKLYQDKFMYDSISDYYCFKDKKHNYGVIVNNFRETYL